MQAPRTIDYEECTISDDSWAGKHERRIDHMIYLILLYFLEVLFPFRYAISTFSATPHMPSVTMMSSEMTDADRPCIHLKTSAQPVSASSPGEEKKKSRTP